MIPSDDFLVRSPGSGPSSRSLPEYTRVIQNLQKVKGLETIFTDSVLEDFRSFVKEKCTRFFKELDDDLLISEALQPRGSIYTRTVNNVIEAFLNQFAFSFPGEKTIEALDVFISRQGKKISDIRIIDSGAGTGLWTHFFRANGIDASGYDFRETQEKYPSQKGEIFINDMHYIESQGDTSYIPEDASDHILFFSWPEKPGVAPFAFNVLNTFKERGGKMLMFVAPPDRGLCANDAFFDELRDKWQEADIPQELEDSLVIDAHPARYNNVGFYTPL